MKLIERSVYLQDTIFKEIILSNAFSIKKEYIADQTRKEYFLDKVFNKCKKTMTERSFKFH